MRPLPRVVLALALLSPLVPALPPALAQECGCNCGQPILGTIAADGSCQCPCDTLSIPGINPESLSGPPRPAKAGGPAPEWQVEPFDDDFGPPGFGVW
ncbi:MAG: hypothetical protein ACNA8O_09770 [Cyanobacteriota bacterium]|nr:hypothetical protein [Cyanobacteriota bacterium]